MGTFVRIFPRVPLFRNSFASIFAQSDNKAKEKTKNYKL